MVFITVMVTAYTCIFHLYCLYAFCVRVVIGVSVWVRLRGCVFLLASRLRDVTRVFLGNYSMHIHTM